MKKYQVQVVNPMVRSIKEIVIAKNKIDAKAKAAKLFTFKGDWKYIIVNEVK